MTNTKTTAVTLEVTPGLFRGLASQNMLFHQCVGELVDNSIAGAPEGKPFSVDITLDSISTLNVNVWVADNTAGMNYETLRHALQPGGSLETGHRLNEHGFGLKNSLATLCRTTKGEWDIWTRAGDSSDVLHVKGPFAREMYIDQMNNFPEKGYYPDDVSTLIRACVPLSFIQTVQGRGRRANDLGILRAYLVEHLGVHYRGYLEQDEDTGNALGKIHVGIKDDKRQVAPIHVPMIEMRKETIEVELQGKPYTLFYRHGVLDETKKEKYKFYYQGNMATQGIDIRLGKRVIITRQLDTIWGKARDNHYNKFVGELIIPDLPPGVLTTKNDKTDFNLSDPDWHNIFEGLQDYLPQKDADREATEAELRDDWKNQLDATKDLGDVVGKEISVWPSATRLDLYKKSPNGDITIYELKRGAAKPLDLYQLKMYWDGLVLAGESPRRAILLVESYTDSIKAMADAMSEKLHPPHKQSGGESNPYRFELATLGEKSLIDSDGKRHKRR